MRGMEETVVEEAVVTFLFSAEPKDSERRIVIYVSYSHGR